MRGYFQHSTAVITAIGAMIIVVASVIAGSGSVNNIHAYGHPVMLSVISNYFRIENEQFSANNVTTGQTIEVKSELTSLVNRNITITPLPLAEQTPHRPDNNLGFYQINSSKWKIENATFTGKFVLGPGETQSFSVNVTALKPGDYSLHSAFAWSLETLNGTMINDTYYGRGQRVIVQNDSSNALDDAIKGRDEPTAEQLQKCQELGIPPENCNDNAILAKMRIVSQPPLSEDDIRKMEEHQNQISNSFYMIGIGAVIAGIIGYITLRKTRR
jgi:hypothetical protein